MEVLAAESDCHFGGVDFDQSLASRFADCKTHSLRATRLLLGACEKATKKRCRADETLGMWFLDGLTVVIRLWLHMIEGASYIMGGRGGMRMEIT